MYYTFDIKKIASYAIIIFIIFISSGGSDLANDKNVMIGGWVFFTGVYLYFENYIKPKFIVLLGIFIGIFILYLVRNDAINAITYLGLFIKIYLAYYCRDLLKELFFKYYVDVVYTLTCISLVMYALQLTINYDLFYDLNNIFRVEKGYYVRSNSIIFTTLPLHEFRNCGFMWEPGAFVTVLTLTYFINLFNIGEPLSSKRNIIFLIAILTTQSTMGYLSLVFPYTLLLKDFIMKARIYQQLSVIILPILLVIGGIIFTQVDFLYKKIMHELTEQEMEMEEIASAMRQDILIDVSRTASFTLDMKTVVEYPLLGLGVDFRTTSLHKLHYHEKLEGSCGTSVLLLRFGIIGFIIYAFLLYKHAAFRTNLQKVTWVLLINYALFTQEISASSLYHLFIF
jgi:hypothetical protein